MIPVILGFDDRHYVIDHHHLARALHEEGVKNVLVTVVANLSMVDRDTFWTVLDNRNWMHPFDDKGRRRFERNRRALSRTVDSRLGAMDNIVRQRGDRR